VTISGALPLEASGVTKVGVTPCCNCWCHPIFSSKSDDLFGHCHHSHPLSFPIDRLSSILINAQAFCYIFIRVSPSWMVSPNPPPDSDATAWGHPSRQSLITRPIVHRLLKFQRNLIMHERVIDDCTHFPCRFSGGRGKEGAILSGLVLRVGWNELHQIGKDNALTGSPRVCFRFSFRKPECLKGVCGGGGQNSL